MAQTWFIKTIAHRYLWARRGEAFIGILTWISVVGVALGVAVIAIVMAVMTGFEHELREKIVGANSHIVVKSINGQIGNWVGVTDSISKVPEVVAVSPFSYNQALVRTDSGATGVLIRGVPEHDSAGQLASYLQRPEDLGLLFNPPPALVPGADETPNEVNLPGIIVGRELSHTLGLFPGSIVSLLSPGVSSTPFGLVPRYKRFVVVATYRSGLIEYESGLAYVSLGAAQEFFRLGDSVYGIEVRIKNIEEAPAAARRIEAAIGGASAGFIVQDWTQTNKPLWDALRLEKRVYFIVLLLIIVMASFSIISTLVMIVLEKRKDIAVLRTIGASSATIGRIFRRQGMIIGGLGTVGGLVLGLSGCLLLQKYGFPLDEKVFPVHTLPIRMEPLNFILVGVAAFLICALATIYPARRAAALEPSDILRRDG